MVIYTMKKIKNKEKTGNNQEEYGYDFVAELAHFTNIDEQREKTHELENIDKKTSKKYKGDVNKYG